MSDFQDSARTLASSFSKNFEEALGDGGEFAKQGESREGDARRERGPTPTRKQQRIEIDGEPYNITISEQQDGEKIEQLATTVNNLLKEIRRKLPNIGYPQLFILALLQLEEKRQNLVNGKTMQVSKASQTTEGPEEKNNEAHTLNDLNTIRSMLANLHSKKGL